jgi:undecaprenyl-diphosphatase
MNETQALSFFEAVFLGVVEGLTEFLPISSTGHLLLAAHFLDLKGSYIDSFIVAIQSGAILAICVLYRRRFFELFFPEKSLNPSSNLTGLNGLLRLFITTVPIGLLGLFFGDLLEALLFNAKTVAAALGFGGVVMILIERKKQIPQSVTLETLSLKQAFYIGIFQCLALWPGMSRSASTIIGSRFLGLSRLDAAQYSFLAAVPVLLAATAYKMLKDPSLLGSGFGVFFIGTAVSFVIALVAVKTFVWFLGRYTLEPFGWYRIILALLVLFLIW